MFKCGHHAITAAVLTSSAACLGGYILYCKYTRKKELEKKLNDIVSIFDKQNCIIKDPAILRRKIRKLLEGGRRKLQLLTDFDRTLTKYFVDGEKGHTSYGVVEHSSYLPASVGKELQALCAKYYPIEMSTSISEKEKIPLMIEWWGRAFQAAVHAKLQKQMIPTMVRDSKVVLREGTDQLLHLLRESDVPILIVSAGLGDVVRETLKQHAVIPPNLTMIANFYKFNADGVVTGIDGELIHTFNKSEVSKHNKQYFVTHKKRSHVIVMGDTLGDPAMADGIDHVDCIIKVGFLNDHVESSIDSYLSVYDIVFTHDTSLDVLNVFLYDVLKGV